MRFNYWILFPFLIAACSSEPGPTTPQRSDEPSVIRVEENDTGMARATQQAKDAFKEFEQALKTNNSKASLFGIKQKFESPNGPEHMWISQIYLKNGVYYGTLANQPQLVQDLQPGDTLRVNLGELSDWKYEENGKVRGAFTVRLLRDRMSEEEREQFDAQTGVVFE